jgi:hypothetical protein
MTMIKEFNYVYLYLNYFNMIFVFDLVIVFTV